MDAGTGLTVADYAHNPHAAASRYAKAQQIARWLWAQGVTSHHLDLWTDEEWGRVCRQAVRRSASDDTRRVVLALLVVKEAWAAAHPGDRDAVRTVLDDAQAAALVAPRRPRTSAPGPRSRGPKA